MLLSNAPAQTAPATTTTVVASTHKSARKARPINWKAYEKRSKNIYIKLQDLTVMSRQLGSMLNAGLPITDALEGLVEQTENIYLKVILNSIRIDVSNGMTLSTAFKKYPKAFPDLLTSMIEAGEASGNLAKIILKVSGYFEESLKLQKAIKSALVYPIAVLCLAFIVVTIMMIFIVPTFTNLFSSVGAELPLPTRVLIGLSDFVKNYILFILAFIFIVVQGTRQYTRTKSGKQTKDQLMNRLPIVSILRQKIAITRFCRTYAILFRSGVPALKIIDICSRASENTFIEKACIDMTATITQGHQLSESLDRDPYFTPMMVYMTKAGEKTSKVDDMFDSVSDFYDTDINATVKSLTSLLEPFLIVSLGIIIGSIVISLFMPIFQLSDAVSHQPKKRPAPVQQKASPASDAPKTAARKASK